MRFIQWYAKIDNKYIKDYDKKKNHSNVNNLYGWAMYRTSVTSRQF